MVQNLIAFVAAALYLTTSVLLGLRLARGVEGQSRSKAPLLTAGFAGVLLHAWLLSHQMIQPAGLDFGFFNALSLITGIMAVILLLAATRKPVEMLGIVLLPSAALAIALSVAIVGESHILVAPGWQLQVHILISIVAYSMLSLAAVQALLLAIQDKHLREKHPGGFVRALPPLQTMEGLLFQMIGLGFALLTVALLTGFFFVEDMFAQHLVHKTVLSLAAWVVFGTLLWGRRRFGWRGRTAIRGTLIGIGVLMLAYFGTKLVLEIILQRPS